MKIFNVALILLLIHFTLHAQQVIKVDCCSDIGSKATIIINDNPTASSTSSNAATTATVSGACNFKMDSPANTSAGVYNSSDILLRTLWSGVHFDAGCYAVQWDGKLDNGTPAPNGNYLIKILSNNVTYKWGLIGNSSKSFTNDEQYNAMTSFYDIALSNNYIYYATGYAERDNQTTKAPLNDLGRRIKVQESINSLSAIKVATDADNVYWSGYSNNGHAFIFAVKQADDSQVPLPNGSAETMDYGGITYNSCIGVSTSGIGGLAVNPTFIFYSRKTDGVVTAYNKSTGATTATNLVTPENMAVTNNGKIWVSNGANCNQYTIGASGGLTSTGLAVPCDENSSIDISPVTGNLAVLRSSLSQIKIYNSSGSLVNTIGQPGGYNITNGPVVTYDKFNFFDYSAVKFGKDGSLWVSDNGNKRILHLTASGNYIEKVSTLGINYCIAVDQSNPTRVFAGNLEFKVDYSKDLSVANNGGWELVNNWQFINPGPTEFQPFLQANTFPNGKTYAKTHAYLFELRPGVGAFYLGGGVEGKNIEKDGSLWTRNTGNPNNVVKQAVTGYDSNTNAPLWGAPQLVVDATNSPVSFNYNNNTLGAATNPGRYFFFNPNSLSDNNSPHFGSIKISGNVTDWLTSPSTPLPRYTGLFPPNGYFDGTGHSENCYTNVVGPNVFWHVNDELGRFTEVCYTNHYNENGLFIGQFGNDNVKAGNTGDTKFLAGNSFFTHAYAVGGDIYYITADESKHAAIQCVKVSNLSSIREDVIQVTLNGAVSALAPASTDLMAYLPYASDDASAIANSGTKWTVTRNGATAFQTSVCTFSKDSIDVYCKTYNGNLSVSRALGTSALNSWILMGKILYQGGSNNYFDILDVNGKRITRLAGYYYDMNINGTTLAAGGIAKARLFNTISYSYFNGTLTILYQGNTKSITIPDESGALLSSPGSIRITQQSGGGDQIIDVYNLKFIPGT